MCTISPDDGRRAVGIYKEEAAVSGQQLRVLRAAAAISGCLN